MNNDKAKAKEMMRWLIMWDKPESELRENKVLPGDVDVDRMVEEIFRKNLNLSIPAISSASIPEFK